jgi:NAD+ synthase
MLYSGVPIMSTNANGIVDWLGQRLTAAGARGFVVGLSGGLDSAVVARLCQLAAPEQVVAAIMPCKSDPRDEADAVQLADHFNLPTVRIDLDAIYDALLAEVRGALTRRDSATPDARGDDSDASRVALGNVRPRLRMTALYFIANSLSYLVAGTGNRSELTVGYFTKHGDGAVDVISSKVMCGIWRAGSMCPSRSSTSPRAPASGSVRPTKRRWGSAIRIWKRI